MFLCNVIFIVSVLSYAPNYFGTKKNITKSILLLLNGACVSELYRPTANHKFTSTQVKFSCTLVGSGRPWCRYATGPYRSFIPCCILSELHTLFVLQVESKLLHWGSLSCTGNSNNLRITGNSNNLSCTGNSNSHCC